MQFAGTALRIDTIPIVNTVGDIRRLLNLDQLNALANRVDCTSGNKVDISALDLITVEQFGQTVSNHCIDKLLA